jgi:two-component system nitrogen regulation sensor histidine kinase NtrY
VRLVVSDDGVGIPPQDRRRVFEPYFSRSENGTGLGLAIVSRIVADHHGYVRVQENPPRGTRFVLELPVARGDAERPRAVPAAQAGAGATR